jgi:drug/metabolite transporter (DMT)-like permease
MRLGLFIVLVSGAIWATTVIAYQQLSNAPPALSITTIYYVGLGLVVLASLLCAVLWKINRRRRPRPTPAAIIREGSSSVGDPPKAIAPRMSDYDRNRRRREIDE